MKKINMLERVKYNGEGKLGCLLDSLLPRYYISNKQVECSENIREVRHEKVGEYSIEFCEIEKDCNFNIVVGNNDNKIHKCRSFVKFNGTLKNEN